MTESHKHKHKVAEQKGALEPSVQPQSHHLGLLTPLDTKPHYFVLASDTHSELSTSRVKLRISPKHGSLAVFAYLQVRNQGCHEFPRSLLLCAETDQLSVYCSFSSAHSPQFICYPAPE